MGWQWASERMASSTILLCNKHSIERTPVSSPWNNYFSRLGSSHSTKHIWRFPAQEFYDLREEFLALILLVYIHALELQGPSYSSSSSSSLPLLQFWRLSLFEQYATPSILSLRICQHSIHILDTTLSPSSFLPDGDEHYMVHTFQSSADNKRVNSKRPTHLCLPAQCKIKVVD